MYRMRYICCTATIIHRFMQFRLRLCGVSVVASIGYQLGQHSPDRFRLGVCKGLIRGSSAPCIPCNIWRATPADLCFYRYTPIRLMTVCSGELLVSFGLNSRTRWFRTQSVTSFCVTDLYNPIIMRIRGGLNSRKGAAALVLDLPPPSMTASTETPTRTACRRSNLEV